MQTAGTQDLSGCWGVSFVVICPLATLSQPFSPFPLRKDVFQATFGQLQASGFCNPVSQPLGKSRQNRFKPLLSPPRQIRDSLLRPVSPGGFLTLLGGTRDTFLGEGEPEGRAGRNAGSWALAKKGAFLKKVFVKHRAKNNSLLVLPLLKIGCALKSGKTLQEFPVRAVRQRKERGSGLRACCFLGPARISHWDLGCRPTTSGALFGVVKFSRTCKLWLLSPLFEGNVSPLSILAALSEPLGPLDPMRGCQ